MNTVFEALPGVEVAVPGIRRALECLWEGAGPAGAEAPAEFRASQLNLVLHLGLPTTPVEGAAQFDLALRFARNHPCRVIVLVPLVGAPPAAPMQAKIHSQCFVGGSREEKSCTEALVLAYPQETRAHVADLVSTLLEPDLPVYYWAHHFSACRKIADYRYLLCTARRFVFDSALVPEEALTFAWPRPEAVRDLAAARLLPVRQLLGQHLAGIAPARLVDGLRTVTVRVTDGLRPEGRALLAWARAALERCGAPAGLAACAVEPLAGAKPELALEFGYRGGRYFRWRADLALGAAGFDAELGRGRELHCAPVRLAPPELALGEALLFP